MDNRLTRKINLITLAAVGMTGVLILIMPTASAAGSPQKVCEVMISVIANAPSVGPTLVLNSNSAIWQYIFNGGSTIINDLMAAFKGLAGFLAIIHGANRYMQSTDRGMEAKEALFRVFKELTIVGILIINSDAIVNIFCSLGMAVIEMVSSRLGLIDLDSVSASLSDRLASWLGTGSTASEIGSFATEAMILGPLQGVWMGTEMFGLDWRQKVQEFCNVNLVQTPFMVLQLILPFSISVIAMGLSIFYSLSLIFEIAIRKAFAPWAIADMYGEGLRSPGMKYLKKLFAAFLKIAMTVFTYNLCSALCCLLFSQSNFSSIFDEESLTQRLGISTGGGIIELLLMTLLQLTAVGVSKSVGEYANDVAEVQ